MSHSSDETKNTCLPKCCYPLLWIVVVFSLLYFIILKKNTVKCFGSFEKRYIW